MSFFEIFFQVVVILGIGFVIYLQSRQIGFLKNKLAVAEDWGKTFNISQLLEQVKSHKELVEIITEQSKKS